MSKTNVFAFIVSLTVLAFIALYGYTGIDKLLDRSYFELTLSRSILSPFATFLSFAVPVTELIICLLLVIPSTKQLGLYAATFLMFLFTVYVAVVLSIKKAPCSCGGFLKSMSWQEHLFFNSGFLLLGLLSLYILRRNKNGYAIAV